MHITLFARRSSTNSHLPALATLVLAVLGLLLVFGPLLHLLTTAPQHGHFNIYHHAVTWASVISLPAAGIMLIYLSLFVYHRRRYAVYWSAGLIVALFIYSIVLYRFSPIVKIYSVLAVLYLAIVVLGYNQFTIKNNLEGLSRYLRQIGIIVIVGLFYGTVGFYVLSEQFFHVHFSLQTSLVMTIDSLTSFGGTINEPTRLGQLFIDSLGGIGIVVFILLLGALFRPLSLRVLSGDSQSAERAKQLVARHSRSSEDFFKLWPHDKHYYFSDDRQAFLAYKQSGKTVVILGDPVGDTKQFTTLLANFVDICRSQGWYMAAINTTKITENILPTHGFSTLFIGNEAIINTGTFHDSTAKNKHFRYVRNRAKRDHLSVEEWTHPTLAQIDQLHAISNSWLARGSRREYTFFMGYFDRDYLQQCRVFVLMQHSRPVAYINLIPSYYHGYESIDHLRSSDNISPVGMHFLLMSIINTLHNEKTKTLNIGLSPLSGISAGEKNLMPKAALRVMKLLGASYYSFQGLEQFKSKFAPTWHPQSLLFSGTMPSLVRITRDVERASTYSPHGGTLRLYLSTAAGVIVLTLGLYFILA
jgi:phosphatidylglycerol lysyltransferase